TEPPAMSSGFARIKNSCLLALMALCSRLLLKSTVFTSNSFQAAGGASDMQDMPTTPYRLQKSRLILLTLRLWQIYDTETDLLRAHYLRGNKLK
ncbi:hypothetical protein BaRGS_00006803, partial [Batillaria attramentaria]